MVTRMIAVAVASALLSIILLISSAFLTGYAIACWRFSNSYIREKVESRLEKELRQRLQFDRENRETKNDANEIKNDINESEKDAMAK